MTLCASARCCGDLSDAASNGGLGGIVVLGVV
jgi:hypothetical protein